MASIFKIPSYRQQWTQSESTIDQQRK